MKGSVQMILKDLENKICNLDQASFQILCDQIFNEMEYSIKPYGTVEGETKTRKGTPDSYSIIEDTCVFFEYTTQKNNLLNKIIKDIYKCIKKSQNFKQIKLSKIVYCLNHNNIDPSIIDQAISICAEHNIIFKLFSANNLISFLLKHKQIIKNVLGMNVSDFGIKTLNEFVKYSKKFNGVDHSNILCGRDEEKKSLVDAINSNNVVVVYGNPGVGKSILLVKAVEKIGIHCLCMKSNAADFIDEILSSVNDSCEHIIFFDDVNEVPLFKIFLESFDADLFSRLKIVCTVRNYALNGVKNILFNFKDINCSFLKIEKISDETIKEILKRNLNINSEEWLDRISYLSKGNPRLALMAGEVAKRDGVKKLIDSKSVMIEYFGIVNNDQIKEILDDYYDVLGVIAFLKRIDITNLESIDKILELCQVTKKRISDLLPILNSAELIDIYEDRVIQIQDQNFSDYIVEIAFFERKICKLSDLLIQLIKTNRKNVIECLNILLNIYSSSEIHNYIETEVKEAWKILEEAKSPLIDTFVLSLYIFNVDKSIDYISDKISSKYKKYCGDVQRFEKCYDHNDYIGVLYHLYEYNNNPLALSLIFEFLDYEDIRNYCFEELKKISILKPKMFVGEKIINDAIFSLLNYRGKNWFNPVVSSIICDALKYNFEFNTQSTDRKILYSYFEIKDNYPGIKEYRTKLWKLATYLDDQYKYKLLNNFVMQCFYSDETKDIFKNDLTNMNYLLSTISHVCNSKEKNLKVSFSSRISGTDISLNDFKIHSNDNLDLCLIILDPRDKRLTYDERKIKHNDQILKIASTANVSDLKKVFKVCNECLIDRNNYWKVSEFIVFLFKHLPKDLLYDIYNEKQYFLSLNKLIKINLVSSLCNGTNAIELIKSLKESDDVDYLDCAISLFNRLDVSEVNEELSLAFEEMIKSDLDSFEQSNASRSASTIAKLLGFGNRFVSCVKHIYSKKDSNVSKVISWLSLLFNEYAFDIEKVVDLFYKEKQLILLENILLLFEKQKVDLYELKDCFYKICSLDTKFLSKCINLHIDYKNNFSNEIFKGLWSQKESFMFADIIFDAITDESHQFSFHSLTARGILVSDDERSNNEAFIKWSIEKIKKINNEKSILILCNYISRCSVEQCKEFYECLIAKELPLNLFYEILGYPSDYSWSGSEVNAVTSKIKRAEQIESIIPSTLEYIKYKKYVKDYICNLKERIKQIKVSERLRFDDYFD